MVTWDGSCFGIVDFHTARKYRRTKETNHARDRFTLT
jgi:hypothetical protein